MLRHYVFLKYRDAARLQRALRRRRGIGGFRARAMVRLAAITIARATLHVSGVPDRRMRMMNLAF
jgi:hypothetical protein